ncbi:MAG: DUF692 domain-containing protein [Deltaproteobacteria bacterium]|nr:DUF692 domain-containing protein [Deltaproteobacteria bacterium]
MKNYNLKSLGAGAGLRHEHFQEIIKKKPAFNWFEIIAEDFINIGGYVQECFEKILSNYTIIPHGVSLSIGSTDALKMDKLKRLKDFCDLINAPWYSDHMCFTMVDHINLEDLIPVPFTQETVDHIVSRIKVVQDVLERPVLFENVTRYITVSDREMSESEFLNQILEKSDCGLLLDVTNVHLNSIYHEFDPYSFIQSLPLERVGQIHLAGWEELPDGNFIDSHDAPVPEAVWELFKKTIALTGPTSVLVEWDKKLPSVERLLKEAQMAEEMMHDVVKAAA